MERIFKWLFLALGVGILVFFCYWIYAVISFGRMFSTPYSKQDLVDNYNKKKPAIIDVKKYLKEIISPGKTVHIEFEGRNKLPIFHVTHNGNNDYNWNIDLNSSKTDTLLQMLGWNKEVLLTLRKKLDKANCISVESGEPSTVGFKRSGMGMYFYKIFDQPLTDSLKNLYNDGCTYIFYDKNIVLEYGGGAVGPQCFESIK